MVFDARIIPNETRLFLGVNGGDYQPVIEKFVREADWRKWDRAESECQIMNDGRTANFMGDTGFAYSKVLPDKGKFIAWVQLSQAPCCISIGPVPASRTIKTWDVDGNPHMIYA